MFNKIIEKRNKKKEIINSAMNEADKIADKQIAKPGYVATTKIPNFTSFAKSQEFWTDDQKKGSLARRNIRNQVIKTRLKQNNF